MQYCGGQVRHTVMQQCNKILLADKHTLLLDEYAFLEDDKPIGNQDNERAMWTQTWMMKQTLTQSQIQICTY